MRQTLGTSRLAHSSVVTLLSPTTDNCLRRLTRQTRHLAHRQFNGAIDFCIPLCLSGLYTGSYACYKFSVDGHVGHGALSRTSVTERDTTVQRVNFRRLLLIANRRRTGIKVSCFHHRLPTLHRRFSSLRVRIRPLTRARCTRLGRLNLSNIVICRRACRRTACTHRRLGKGGRSFF